METNTEQDKLKEKRAPRLLILSIILVMVATILAILMPPEMVTTIGTVGGNP